MPGPIFAQARDKITITANICLGALRMPVACVLHSDKYLILRVPYRGSCTGMEPVHHVIWNFIDLITKECLLAAQTDVNRKCIIHSVQTKMECNNSIKKREYCALDFSFISFHSLGIGNHDQHWHADRVYFIIIISNVIIIIAVWLVTDICHQPIFEKFASVRRLSLAKTH